MKISFCDFEFGAVMHFESDLVRWWFHFYSRVFRPLGSALNSTWINPYNDNDKDNDDDDDDDKKEEKECSISIHEFSAHLAVHSPQLGSTNMFSKICWLESG